MMVTAAKQLLKGDPAYQARVNELLRIINSNSELSTPEALRSIFKAAATQILIDDGRLELPPAPPPPPVPDEIRNARQYLDDYGEYVHGFSPTPFHLEWMRALYDPKIDRLLIIAPPDHAKTQTVIEWCCSLIGNTPTVHIGLLSNTATQANRKSVAVRDTIAYNERYHLVFPNVVPDKEKGWSESEWFVKRADPGDKDSTFKAAGVFGPITGDRYDYIIFDDIADLENTATALQREKVRNWVEITAMSRLVKGGKAVAIMTRYHEEDVAAYFKKLGWTVIHMPALDENNQALWEERWPAAALLERKAQGPLTFERVYQGRPTPQEGSLVKEEWWQWYDELPIEEPEIIIQVLDTAGKTKTLNDPSVIATWAKINNNAYLLDLVRDQMEYPQLKRAAIAQFMRWRPQRVVIESASSGISLYQDLKQNTDLPVKEIVVSKDKVTRLTAVLDYIATGRCYLPRNAPWVGAFIREHAEFPLGAHDDMVDTTGMSISELFLNSRWSSSGFMHLGQGIDETRQEVVKKLREQMVAQ